MVKTFVVIMVIATFFSMTFISKAQAPQRGINEYTPRELSEYYADVYGGEAKLAPSVIFCESSFDPTAVGDGGRAKNVGQFHRESFNRLAKAMGEELDYDSWSDQTKLLAWSLANGHGKEWTTYVAIKKDGVYRFYSKLMKRWYTVRCEENDYKLATG